jgi:Glyoxalase/Bleomycin resistance protein/Dioxygenase superfamily
VRELNTNVLGFEKRFDNLAPDGPRFLAVGIKGDELLVILLPGTPGRGKPVQGHIPQVRTIEVEGCRAAVEALKSRGVKFDSPQIVEQPWGFRASFQDPDGNQLALREGRRA